MAPKSLEELNLEFMSGNPSRKITPAQPAAALPRREKPRGALSSITGILFYLAILLLLFSLLTSSRYSFYTVITPGLRDDLPTGSLILLEHTDREIANEENVAGTVVFSIPVVGAVMSWLVEYIYIVFIIFGLCLVLYLINQKGMKKEDEKRNKSKTNRYPV